MHLHLVQMRQVLFHRVFDGGDIHRSGGKRAQCHIQCRCLTGTGRSGDIDQAVRRFQHSGELCIVVRCHTKGLTAINIAVGSQDTHNHLLTEYGRDYADTDVDDLVTDTDTEMSVLRYTAFRDIQLTDDLDTRHQSVLHVFVQCHIVQQYTVGTHTHQDLFFERLDMYVGCAVLISFIQQGVYQVDDRCIVRRYVSIDDDFLCLAGGCIFTRVRRCLFGLDRSVMIGDGILQRLGFCQERMDIHTTGLTQVFDRVQVQRIIHGNRQCTVRYRYRQHQILLRHLDRNDLYRFFLYRIGRDIDQTGLQTIRQCRQHLTLLHIPLLNEDLSDTLGTVLLLQCQRFHQLLLRDIPGVYHQIAQTYFLDQFIIHTIRSPLS